MAAYTSSKQPKDQGYAWVILASCCIIRMLVDGFWSSFGVIFVKLEFQFDITPAETSIIGSIFMFAFAMAPISSALSHQFSSRLVVMGAGIFTVVCFASAAFVTQFWHLYVIFGILSVSMGSAYQSTFTCFIPYFDRHFVLANMLCGAAASVGYLVIPILMEFLMSYYGWRDGFLITSAIMANICLAGLLLKSPIIETGPNVSSSIKSVKIHPAANDQKIRVMKSDKPAETMTKKRKRSSVISALHDVSKASDISLFRNVHFLFEGILNSFLFGGVITAAVYIVPLAVSIGIPDTKSAFLMVAYGLCMLIVRLIPVGIVVDKHIISASKLSGVIHLLNGILVMTVSLVNTFEQLLFASGFIGVLTGLGSPLLYVVAADSAGSRDRSPAAMSWFLLGMGVGMSSTIFLFGMLQTVTGSFTCSMILCGVYIFCMGIILLLDPVFRQWHVKRQQKQEAKSYHNVPIEV